jgi:alkylation response protein AidB-like acyl-CoA dehydrogenase
MTGAEVDPDLLAMVDDVTAADLAPLLAAATDDRFPADARATLEEVGLWSLAIGEDAGGGGADRATLLAVLHRLAAGGAAAGAVAVLHQHAVALTVPATDVPARVAAGAVAVLVDGDPAFGRALPTRFDAGLDPDVVLVCEGARLRLLTGAEIPGWDPARRTGLAGLGTTLVALDPAAGREVPGDPVAARELWVLGLAAAASGCAAAAANAAAAHARSRVQFGAALVALPAVAHRLAEVAAVAAASARTLRGDPVLAADRALTEARTAVLRALGVLGGYGYLEEYPIAGLLRDVVSLSAAAGITPAALAGSAS